MKMLDRFVNAYPPRNSLYIQRLRNKLALDNVINVSEFIESLALAGYNMDQIVQFFIVSGIIESGEKAIEFRDAVARVLMKMERE